MEKKASRIGELAFAGTEPVQLRIPRPLQVHSPQPQPKASLVPSQQISTGGLPSLQPATISVPGKDTGRQASNRMLKCPNSGQQVCATHGSAGQSPVPGSSGQAKLQVRPQPGLAIPKRAVNTIYHASQAVHQAVHQGRTHDPSCPKTRAVPQQVQACPAATRRTNHLPASAPAPMENTCIVHLKQCQKETPKILVQPSHLLSTATSRGTPQYCANTGYSAWNAGQSIRQTVREWSCWQTFSALASLTGATLGRGILACFKQYWSAKKSIGSCGLGAFF